MVRFLRCLGVATFLALPAPAVPTPPALQCAEAPCRICFVVVELVDRAGGEPHSCAA
jgi:hypothetical protein